MNKTPIVRFDEFTEDWEQRKLSDCCGQLSATLNPQDTPDDIFAEYSMPAFDNGEVPDIVTGNTMNSARKILDRPCLLINKLNVRKRRIWNVEIPKKNSVSSAEFVPVYSDEINLGFLKHIVLSDYFTAFLEDCSSGSSNSQKRVTPDVIMSAIILLPSKGEQDRIGEFLAKLDDTITLQQRKYAKLINAKKTMLYKMFPQNGSKTPEIRFKGFTEDWEEKKLEKWGSFYYGRSCPKWSVTDDATIPCIRYGELYTKFGEKIDKVFSHTNMPSKNLRFSKGNEVLIPRVGEDPRDYNHCTWLSMKGVAIGEMISVFNTDQNPLFAAIMFNATLQEKFAVRVEGGSVTNLYYDKLKDIDTSFPSLEEQEKIATFFETLNNSITLHKRKLEKLKNLKQAMLHKMFV